MKPLFRDALKLAGVKARDLDSAVQEARTLTHHVHMVTGIASKTLEALAQKPMHPKVKKLVEGAAKGAAKAHRAAETMVTVRLPNGVKR
jgi:hypothetical protein